MLSISPINTHYLGHYYKSHLEKEDASVACLGKKTKWYSSVMTCSIVVILYQNIEMKSGRQGHTYP